jgi:Skp family chaperone for outer membrane proteins
MSSVKKITPLLVLLSAVSLLSPSMAAAQAAKQLKIGFVNVQRLLIESPQANAANRALEN